MKISAKNIIRFSLATAILSWLAFVFADLNLLFGSLRNVKVGIPDELPNLSMDLFIVALFFYYRSRTYRVENINFIDMLWRVFATGLLATVASLVIKFIFIAWGNTKLAQNTFVINLSYHINFGLIAAFLISTFIVWKRLILYQKSKLLLNGWQVFEYIFLITLVLDLVYPDLDSGINVVLLVILILMGLIFSVNLKWVAYLNFRQKWKSILLILLVLLYLGYFIQNLWRFAANNPLTTDILQNTFFIALLTFVFLYALFSLLVILFNLPTSSVFEQKLEEVLNFQRLSQSIQTEKSEDQVYEILLQSACSTVFADAGWIEIIQNGDSHYQSKNIDETEIGQVKELISSGKVKGILDTDTDRSLKSSTQQNVLKGTKFKSIIAYPILVQGQQTGTLALLKEISDGFNKEMTDITRTFVNQAGISIENFRLLSEALENERYKEELKIAKEVQKSLLPTDLAANDDFDLSAFSEAADEVGGDYYDALRVDEDRIALMIGDVSGKGTSAAFHMSQMKGIFSSLAQMGMGPKEFLIHANTALSTSLEKASFITASYFLISQKNKTVEFSRAGHCPTLYYNAKDKKSVFYEDKGLGLGILRNTNFEQYVEVRTLQYKPGDILVLYTDGITEAKNGKRDEFGYEKMQEILEANAELGAEEIKQLIMDDLYSFCGQEFVDDDYTMVIVKFK